MGKPSFTRRVIGELDNSALGGDMNTFFTVADINGDGRPDIVVCGRSGRMAWFENKGPGRSWERHIVAEVANQECGGVALDLTGSGYADIINGGDWQSDELSWWENPGPNNGTWPRRIIAKTSRNQFHDVAVGDITGDGRKSLVFWNQGGAALYWVPIPGEPRVSPWSGIEVIATDMRENGQPEEGIAIADIDGDGRNEVVAGTHWYKYTGRPGAEWERHKFARGYITTVVAVGDIDGDGRNEIVLSEGDPCIYGRPEGGKLAWFKPGRDITALWQEHVLEDHLLDAHSLQLGNICGSGHLDILVGEIGVRDRLEQNPPRLIVFENNGKASFTRHVIDQGIGVHHARIADFRGRGVLDIASRPLHGPDKWKVFIWYNNAGGKVE
ncbi:MAG: FG-GAP repeat domain-containing protein [Armatimonadota bacterium]